MALPAAASAQPVDGLYIGAAGLGNILHNETNPPVPTAQGVREPQNRRVEIILK